MVSPQLGQAAFRIAMFLVVVSLGLLLVLEANTAEFYITLITLALGVIFGLVIIVVVRR